MADAPKPFWYDGKPDADGEYYVILLTGQGAEEQPGWYFEVAGEPYGPYSTEGDARNAAQETDNG